MEGVKNNLAMMDQYKAGTVSHKPASGENTGAADTPAVASDEKFNQNIDSMVGWLNGLQDEFKVVGADIKRHTTATTPAQVKLIRERLVNMNHLKPREKGSSTWYFKQTPKSIEKPAEIAAEPAKKAKVFNIFRR